MGNEAGTSGEGLESPGEVSVGEGDSGWGSTWDRDGTEAERRYETRAASVGQRWSAGQGQRQSAGVGQASLARGGGAGPGPAEGWTRWSCSGGVLVCFISSRKTECAQEPSLVALPPQQLDHHHKASDQRH